MGLDGYVARTAQNSNLIYCKKHNQLLGQTITVPSFLAMGYLMFDNTTYKHSRLYHTVYSRSKNRFLKYFTITCCRNIKCFITDVSKRILCMNYLN